MLSSFKALLHTIALRTSRDANKRPAASEQVLKLSVPASNIAHEYTSVLNTCPQPYPDLPG